LSWIQRLYETYEKCDGAPQFEKTPLLPQGHMPQQAHVEIVLDGDGAFVRAAVLNRETTIVPVTEASAGRAGSALRPHPLCDKVQYCASDYSRLGGEKKPGFDEYVELLSQWQDSCPHPKVQAVLRYVRQESVTRDLVDAGILHCAGGKLLTTWSGASAPEIFKVLTPKDGKRDQGDSFVRWSVQIPGDLIPVVSEDPAVRASWIEFLSTREKTCGTCMVTGETVALAQNHPKRLRHGADGAKLLSSNDESGFTFRGRFESALQAYGLGSVVTQKAHSALRWLIERQGRKGDQCFVAWEVAGKEIPDPLKNTQALGDPFALPGEYPPDSGGSYSGDAGQLFALRLNRLISGYRATLSDTDNVVVMGLDSATPGRMAITYYRELSGSEFLDRVLSWHTRYSWLQNFGKTARFVGAPCPEDIAEVAYGRRLDTKLRKATVERLLPCIVDARPLPADLLQRTVQRASARGGLANWEWEKCLGIACALVRGRSEENYTMALEEERTTRDYLYGRLLAIAENIEQRALYVAGENRETNAGRLMQRFASHPCSTWRNLELALRPSITRLRANRPGALQVREALLDKVQSMFRAEDFTSDAKLSGEFLLGYHCQRTALWTKANANEPVSEGETK
jgi:CRISPR-associated protein Csd1